MIRGFLTGALIASLTLLVYLSFHLGVFKTVEIKEEVRGPYYLLYQKHTGPYFQISELISKIELSAKQASLSCDLTFGEYFDNPKEVDADRLRSRGGCLSLQPYTRALDGLEIDHLPEQRYVIAKFSGSPSIGPWKVYPRVQAYLDERRLHSMEESVEIYDIKNGEMTTEYLFPLK